MGKRHARAAALQYTSQAAEELRESEAGFTRAEDTRALLESYLGTEAQAAGTGQFAGAGDPRLAAYGKRYQLDELYAQETMQNLRGLRHNVDPFTSGYDQFRGGASGMDYWRGFETQANDLLAQAEEAAKAGDFEAADKFRDQASQVIGGLKAHAQRGFNLVSDPRTRALQAASSAQGRIVGGMLKTGREFMDPESEGSMKFKRTLTEGAERSIASESRAAQRQIRDLGMVRGAGRSATAQQAIAARSAETFAAQRAQVHTQAAEFFQTFRLGFAQDAVKFAQDWTQNVAGVRDKYNENVANVKAQTAETSLSVAAQMWEKYGADLGAERARKASATGKIMGGVAAAASIVGAFFTGGATLAALPGAVSMAGGGK